jgi:hypothetical protein
MKKLIIGFLSIMLAVAVTANEKEGKTAVNSDNTATVALSGTVLDGTSGELLVGVEVKIEGTETKAYTDFDGNFTFENVKPGEYKLVTNYISYNKTTETLKVDGNKKEVKIQLENSK